MKTIPESTYMINMTAGRPASRADVDIAPSHEEFESLQQMMDRALESHDHKLAERCIDDAERKWPDGMPAFLLRAQRLVHENESEAALDTAREGLLHPIGASATVLRHLLSLVAKLGGRLIVRTTPLHPQVGDLLDPQSLMSIARQMVSYGDTVRAHAFGKRIIAKSPGSRALVDATLGMSDNEETSSEDVDWDADFISIDQPGSDRAIVVFTGLRHETAVPLRTLYEELRPLKAHFIALRDVDRLLFLGGLPYLGSNPGESASLLRSHAESMGARKIFVVGNSAGGVGALLYGSLMKADAIVGYGAITEVCVPWETRGMAVRRRCEALAGSWIGPSRARLSAIEPPIPVLLNYGADMTLDAQQAEALAPTPGVQLRPLPGFDGHPVIVELIKSGRFLPELREFLGQVDPALLDEDPLEAG